MPASKFNYSDPCGGPQNDPASKPALSSAAYSILSVAGKAPEVLGWAVMPQQALPGSPVEMDLRSLCGVRPLQHVSLGGGDVGVLVAGSVQEFRRGCRNVERGIVPSVYSMSEGAVPPKMLVNGLIDPDKHVLLMLADMPGAVLQPDLLQLLADMGVNVEQASRAPSSVCPVGFLCGVANAAAAVALKHLDQRGGLLPVSRKGASVLLRLSDQGDPADGAGQVFSIARAIEARVQSGGRSEDNVQHYAAVIGHRPGALLELVKRAAPYVSADCSLRAGLSAPVPGQAPAARQAAVVLSMRNRSKEQRHAIEEAVAQAGRRLSVPVDSAWLLP